MILSIDELRKTLFTGRQAEINEFSFTALIKKRHRDFWMSVDSDQIRRIEMTYKEPIEEWKVFNNWQRILSNKINALHFAKMHGCKIPDMYWIGDNVKEINFDLLPDQYVIKPSIGHSCQQVFLMNKGINMLDGRRYKNNQLLAIMRQKLTDTPNCKFLIQEFLKNEKGEYIIPVDYKLHTFNGTIARIEALQRTGSHSGTDNLYDLDWNPQANIGVHYKDGPQLAAPLCIAEIKEKCRILSKAYEIYVRIDFYATDKGAVFGEFTPTPGVGQGFTAEADQLFTRYWSKFCNGKI